ncbi:unnamed protein product [Allacma fusca]|uniref:Uncharacterized protein n=1 Tax=Allacma fusca TaxID=39272 RepID=A0A8J2LDA4_9HEXA|nr:unnamed protein product [Allacma fusca]
MNLTRMRQMDFSNEMRLIFEGYKKLLKFHDQDLLNIYFHFHPQWLYVLPCEFNYGLHFCHCFPDKVGSCSCRNAESSGIAVLHGSSGQFHSKDNQLFRQIYDTFTKLNVSKQQPSDVLTLLKQRHQNLKGRCSQLNLTIYRKMEKYI